MNKIKVLVITLIVLFCPPCLYGQKVAEPFEFQFEHKTLRGLIESPSNQVSKAIIIIIPGYGETNFVAGNWFGALRDKFVEAGLTVCFWDKMGCGKSEGEFDAQQPVTNSADEALAAIQEIKKLNIAGSDKIGLWGISRAGWICPLINEQYPIDFWISVSGTDDKENFGYLLKSNLLIAGKEEDEAERLFQAWQLGHQRYCSGDKYERYLKAILPLMQDSLCRSLFGYSNQVNITDEDRSAYRQGQQLYTSTGHFDSESGLWVYLENFEQTLTRINCPVLAIFGANDSQVDWVKTKKLYAATIGGKSNSALTVQVFENCNHNLQQCVTCGYQEDLSPYGWQACDNYYETMMAWLKDKKITE